MAVALRIAAGTARATALAAGQRLLIQNVEGGQVADFVAFNAADLDETFSTTHTLVALGRLFPTTGDQLRSNRRRPMLTITRDDTGRHDLLIPACDRWRYENDFGVTGHRSCVDNFLEVLQPWRITHARLPHPLNFFQHMRYPEGRVEFDTSLAKPGDVVELAALMDLVVAVSACPMDLNPISGYRVHEIAIEVR
jgi:uncharacterized protein YcgI (DUF1989 family)